MITIQLTEYELETLIMYLNLLESIGEDTEESRQLAEKLESIEETELERLYTQVRRQNIKRC